LSSLIATSSYFSNNASLDCISDANATLVTEANAPMHLSIRSTDNSACVYFAQSAASVIVNVAIAIHFRRELHVLMQVVQTISGMISATQHNLRTCTYLFCLSSAHNHAAQS
jgi:hypothetical protein